MLNWNLDPFPPAEDTFTTKSANTSYGLWKLRTETDSGYTTLTFIPHRPSPQISVFLESRIYDSIITMGVFSDHKDAHHFAMRWHEAVDGRKRGGLLMPLSKRPTDGPISVHPHHLTLTTDDKKISIKRCRPTAIWMRPNDPDQSLADTLDHHILHEIATKPKEQEHVSL